MTKAERIADDAAHDYAQYLAHVAAYNAERASRGRPPIVPQPPASVPTPETSAAPTPEPGPGKVLVPTANRFGKTGVGPADNPNTDRLYFARLIRPVDSVGMLLEREAQKAVFDIDNTNFSVSFGEYLLYVEEPESFLTTTSVALMRNYAGQQAYVPTRLLQDKRGAWGLTGDLLDANGSSLNICFLRWQFSKHEAYVLSSQRRIEWENMECVLSVEPTAEAEADEFPPLEGSEELIMDADGNYAILDSSLIPPNPPGVKFIEGIDDPEFHPQVFIAAQIFSRPWNILVYHDGAASAASEARLAVHEAGVADGTIDPNE